MKITSNKGMSKKRRVMASSFQTDYTSDDFRRDLEQLCNDIVDEYDGEEDIDDFIRQQLDYFIESECTYYADCIKIIWASNVTDWSDADYEITSLGALAGWIIESEFYQEGYYDDVMERLSGSAKSEDDEDFEDIDYFPDENE